MSVEEGKDCSGGGGQGAASNRRAATTARRLAPTPPQIIVFSDNIFALRKYAVLMRRPFIYGGTSHQERTRVLHRFKTSSDLNTVFLSKARACDCLAALWGLGAGAPGAMGAEQRPQHRVPVQGAARARLGGLMGVGGQCPW